MKHTKETPTGNDRPDKWMQTSLYGIVKSAKRDKKRRYRSLYSLLNKTNLRAAYYLLNKKAAVGTDKMDFYEYGKDLESNLDELVGSLKEKRYHAKLLKRVYIPKGGGKTRPLGIPAIADKVLQLAVTQILSAIFEVDFLDTSFGYRPGKSAHHALQSLRSGVDDRKSWVVEADIKSFFDNIDHDYMVKMLEQRVNDRPFIRLILKRLKAGVMEPKGDIVYPATGTPQGGIVSPVLANIYLHYVLDLWFEKRFKPSCSGRACYVRYADDYVAAFQYLADARRFMQEMKERLRKFGLELAPDKSGMILFNRFKKDQSGTFDFLGFEFYRGVTRSGHVMVMNRTSKSRLRKSALAVREWCKSNRNKRLRNIFHMMNQKLTGYYNYFGVSGNSKRLWQFHQIVVKNLYRWLNRRSQRRSFNWSTFSEIIKFYGLKQPVILKSLQSPKGVSFA